MATVQSLRTFVNERLTVAVEEILGVFEKTIVVYEEEIDRQRKLLDIVLKPQIKLHRTEPPQPSVCKEEPLLDQQYCDQESNTSPRQEVPEPPQIKKEPEELCSSQEGEQPSVKEEADVYLPQPFVCKEEILLDHQYCNQGSNSSLGQKVPEPPQIKEEPEELCSSQEGEPPSVQEEPDVCKLTAASEGSDHSEQEALHSDTDETLSAAEEEAVANISFKLIKAKADREDSGVSGPNSDRRLRSHNRHVAETEGYKTSSCGNAGSTQRTEPKQQNRRYNCDNHSKEFSDLNKFRTPKKTHHGKQIFKCDTCEKVFCRSRYLVHMRTHTGEKPFRCKVCGKGFSSQSYCSDHIRIHTGEKPYSCNTCGKEFAFRSTLKEHLRVHTGEKPYKCGFCGQRFTLRSNMTRHTKIHTGEKPLKCSTCGKAFAQSASLKIHRRIHTGERPYRCGTCDKRFISSTHLKRHMIVHTGSASSST